MFANGVLTIAQISIPSVYLPISLTFNEQLTGLGILTSLFFLGFVVIEFPGGIWSSRVGPRRVAFTASGLVSAAVFASALSPSFAVLAALRFVVGFGVGLSVPSVYVIGMRAFGGRSTGLGVALVQGSSSLAAGLGLPGWSVLAAVFGWRTSLAVDGVLTASVAVLLVLLVPPDGATSVRQSLSVSDLSRLLSNRRLQIIALCLFGTGVTGTLTGNFMVYYLEKVFGMQPGYAGSISGIGYFGPILTAIYVGRLYDRGRDARYLIFAATVLLGLGTAILAIHSIYAAIVAVVVCGVAGSPIGTLAFAVTRRLAPTADLEPLAIGFVDSLALLGVFAGALVFPFLVLGLGYPSAWILGGSIGIILTIPVILAKEL